ncbi:MAG TPA: carbohydrate binding domain-containing protein, partial [Clostridia bacterium]|nr:carbohydrate binding domain-containing protein [Clostridia bacterium]
MKKTRAIGITNPVRVLLLSLFVVFTCAAAVPSGNLLVNGGFESGLAGWRPFWSRETGAGDVALDHNSSKAGTRSARIEHHGSADWSLDQESRLPVQAGELFEMEAFVKLQGSGSVTLCASTWDSRGQNLSWSYAERKAEATKDWTRLHTRFVIPPDVAHIQPRLIGYGQANVWVDDCSLIKKPTPGLTERSKLPGTLSLTNAALAITFDTTNATLAVVDRRTHRLWTQKPTQADVLVTKAHSRSNQIELGLLHVPSGLDLKAWIKLDSTKPEFTFAVEGQGELPGAIRFPYPLTSQSGDWLVIPMNEGIAYPVEDESIETFRLIAYGGHGICMAFWGVTDGKAGHAVIIETP